MPEEPVGNAAASVPAGRSTKTRVVQAVQLIGEHTNKFGLFVLSLLATLLLPCLPVVVELAEGGAAKNETVLITATVLAAGLAFTAENALCFSIYLVSFLFSFMYFMIDSLSLSHLVAALCGSAAPKLAPSALATYVSPGTLLGCTAFLHAGERSWWHVGLDRAFPESSLWRRAGGHHD